MYVGIPYAPISPAYSLMSSDFGKLRAIIELLTPGLVFANRRRAVRARDLRGGAGRRRTGGGAQSAGRPEGHAVRRSARRARTPPASPPRTPRSTPDTIAKFLFTSGSTGNPKGVINTQRMLCSNQAMIAAGFAFVADEPPVVVDWLPWSHTVRQQPQLQHGARQRRLALYRRRQSDAAGRAEDRAQSARDRADHLFQRAERLRGAGAAFPRRRRCCATISSAG